MEKTFCFRHKICYNRTMKNTNKNNNQKGSAPSRKQALTQALLQTPSRENSSGFAFSFLVLFSFAITLVVSLILSACGFDPKKDVSKDWYLYLAYCLSPVAILGALVWYFHRTKKSVVQTLKKQRCSWEYFVVAVLLQIGLFSLSYVNVLFITLLEKLGYHATESKLPSMDGFGIVGVLFVVAVLPAVFEEAIFRGVLLDGAHAYGTAGAALLCGGLFSIYHQSPEQTIYQFICGAAFALLAIRAGSVLPTMLAHFLNNAVLIVLQKFGVTTMSTTAIIIQVVVGALCLITTLFYLIFIDKHTLPKEESQDEPSKQKSVYILAASIGVLVCFVSWATNFYTGFYGG